MGSRATPLIRIRPKEITAAGVERVARVAGVKDGLPVLEDGRVLEVANVVWTTGFHHDFSWIDLPASATASRPTSAGWSTASPGCTWSACTSCTRCPRP